MTAKMSRKTFFTIIAIIGMLHIFLALWFGMKKEGFHEDEYYTYWSSAATTEMKPYGNYQWHSGYELQSRFFVKRGEQFSFSEVVSNQEEDVHPPLYYLSLNVVMSLFPNQFYKWFGILLNLLFSIVAYGGILFFFYHVDKSKYRCLLTLIAGLIYAASPSAISSIMLTRMYAMFTMWTVLYADIFVLLIENFNCSRKRFAAILSGGALICYLSALTHYFALVMPFLLTLAYCIYVLVKRKGFIRMLLYGLSMLASIGLAVWTYPACINHIFHGYRGEGALEGLSAHNLFGMMKMFLPIMDKNIFAGLMRPCVVITAVCLFAGSVFLIGRKVKKTGRTVTFFYTFAATLIACLIEFWFLTRTALFVGDASCRYFYPVIALILPLMAYSICKLFFYLKESFYDVRSKKIGKGTKTDYFFYGILAVITIVPLVMGYFQKNVLFLYEDEKEKKAFSQEYSEYPAIMLFSSDKIYRSWYVDDQLWPFQNIFYVDYDHIMMDFEDERLETAEKIVVYMDCPEDALEKLVENNPNLSTCSLVRHDPFFYIYLLE